MRTNEEIAEQSVQIAKKFLELRGLEYKPFEGEEFRFLDLYRSIDPYATQAWTMVSFVQDILTDTDLNNVVAELEQEELNLNALTKEAIETPETSLTEILRNTKIRCAVKYYRVSKGGMFYDIDASDFLSTPASLNPSEILAAVKSNTERQNQGWSIAAAIKVEGIVIAIATCNGFLVKAEAEQYRQLLLDNINES